LQSRIPLGATLRVRSSQKLVERLAIEDVFLQEIT
jgi:hypothetical protein